MRKSSKQTKKTTGKKTQTQVARRSSSLRESEQKRRISRRISVGKDEFSISPEIINLVMKKYKKSIIFCNNYVRIEHIVKAMIQKHKYILYYHKDLGMFLPSMIQTYKNCFSNNNTQVFHKVDLNDFNEKTSKEHNVFLKQMPQGINPDIIIVENFLDSGNEYKGVVPSKLYLFSDYENTDKYFDIKNSYYDKYLRQVDYNVLKI